jgi:hypothetical protein
MQKPTKRGCRGDGCSPSRWLRLEAPLAGVQKGASGGEQKAADGKPYASDSKVFGGDRDTRQHQGHGANRPQKRPKATLPRRQSEREREADAAAKLALYTQEREMTARVAKLCSEANVEQVEATVKQAQVEMVAKQVRDAAQLIGLKSDQVRALGRALRLLSAPASGGDPGADVELQRLLDQIQAEDERRIERAAKKEAERLSGLTLPPEEWVTAPADLG